MDLTDAALADGLCRPAGRKNRRNVELSRCERNWHRKDRANGEISGEKKRPPCTRHSGRGGQTDTDVDLSQGLLHCKQAGSESVNVIVFDQFFDTLVDLLDDGLDLGLFFFDHVSIATRHFGIDLLDFVE